MTMFWVGQTMSARGALQSPHADAHGLQANQVRLAPYQNALHTSLAVLSFDHQCAQVALRSCSPLPSTTPAISA